MKSVAFVGLPALVVAGIDTGDWESLRGMGLSRSEIRGLVPAVRVKLGVTPPPAKELFTTNWAGRHLMARTNGGYE